MAAQAVEDTTPMNVNFLQRAPQVATGEIDKQRLCGFGDRHTLIGIRGDANQIQSPDQY